jgi:hypothetical protein
LGASRRDTKILENYSKKVKEENQKKLLFKNLRTEVNTGANGTQDYIIKKGTNIGKVAKK